MLLLAPAVDELCSAAATVTAPGILADLGLSVAALTTMALVLPVVLSFAIEPAAMWLADGRWRRPLLVASAFAWAGSFVLAGAARTPWMLAVALMVAGPMSGVTLGVARVALLSRHNDGERVLTRWTLMAALGDLAGPLIYAAILTMGGGWRHGFFVFAAVLGLYAMACLRVPPGIAVDQDENQPWWPSVRDALRDRPLVMWLFAVVLCTLLDEIMVILSSLRVASLPDGGERLASFGAAAFLAGMVVGLTAIERRWMAPHLGWACGLSLVGLIWVLSASQAYWLLAGLFVVGLGAGPQYPLALARAHARRPDRPGLVSALGALFTPAELALPWLVGLCADRWGLLAALVVLALQPLGILGVLLSQVRRPESMRA